MTFEWRTDVGDAAEPARAPREPRRPRSGWRYLLPAVLLGLLALLAATLATEQADALGQQAGE